MLDHVGFGVSDCKRSKAFYSDALAPLDIELTMEPSGQEAGFGRTGKPWQQRRGGLPPSGLTRAKGRLLLLGLHHRAFVCAATTLGSRAKDA